MTDNETQNESGTVAQIDSNESGTGGEIDSLTIILASASPRRKQLLADAGVTFRVHTPQTPVDETLDADQASNPEEACKDLAQRKAGAVVQEVLANPAPGMYMIIGADTMVVKDGDIFGKPRNLSDATSMLRRLSGATHEVITAVSLWLVRVDEQDEVSLGLRTFADTARVTFKPLDDETIKEYLRKGESFDKAGAYAIQGEGAALVERVDGSLDTVIGLPVGRLLKDYPELLQASPR